MRFSALFIDDGGVMNDNRPRERQWQKLVAEYFVPVLGGTHEKWEEANRLILKQLLSQTFDKPSFKVADYKVFNRNWQLEWLRGMASHVNVTVPKDDDECIVMADASNVYVTHRVHSAFPGAIDAINKFNGAGLKLFTASGERSLELDGYLTAMGVRKKFLTLYGPDLVDKFKDDAQYYKAIFLHSGIDPSSALVIDDRPDYLQLARSVGASTCLITSNPQASHTAHMAATNLAEVPELLMM